MIPSRRLGREASPVYANQLTTIPVSITFSSTPTVYNVSKATLKYDKDFAWSFTLDDGLVTAITNAYPIITGIGTDENGSSYSACKYTDGCGNDILFSIQMAWYSVNVSGTDLHNGNGQNLTYAQALTLYNAGWDLINHSWSHANGTGNTPGFPGVGHPNYSYEISQNVSTIQTNMGISVQPYLIIPAGDSNYLYYAIQAGYIAIFNQGGSLFVGQAVDGIVGIRLDDKYLNRPFTLFRQLRDDGSSGTDAYPNITSNIDSMATLAVNGKKYWYNEFSHGIQTNKVNTSMTISLFSQYMQYVSNTYGKNGSDRVWMASLQRVYEYIRFREDCIITPPTLSGNVLSFNIQHTFTNSTMKYMQLTLKINSDVDISSVSVPAGYTMSFRGSGSNRIINIEKTL